MRTKALLLAASVAAGALSSQAQTNVYSVNVVGYVNVTIAPGFNLLSAPLLAANSGVNTVLANTTPVFPADGVLYTWNPAIANFNQAIFAGGDGLWYDANFALATNQVPPGTSFFVQNNGTNSLTMTLTGTVIQGTNGYVVNKGFGFYGDPEPIVGNIATNGFPVQDGSTLYTWNTGIQNYNQAVFGDSGGFVDGNFNPIVVAPAIGTGFIYLNPTTNNVSWTRSFIVQ